MDSPLGLTIGNRLIAYLNTADDYHKYRKRLNKQILKLRHELDLVTKDTKHYKTKEKLSKISIEDYDKNDKFGLILLLISERDLLYSLEIKTLLEISNEGNVSSYKNLMISKLKKSINGSKKLLQLINNETNLNKIIEVYMYISLNEGSLAIHKRQWSKALQAFSTARCGLEYLNDNLTKDLETDNLNKSIINELINTIVDPSLNLSISQLDLGLIDCKSISRKYCKAINELPYLSKVIDIIASLDASYVNELSSHVSKIESINWRNHEAKLYNDEISFKLINLLATDNSKVEKIEKFDELITGWNEVLELHQIDLSKHQDEDDNEKIQDRAILLTFINYNLLFTKIRRDLILINELEGKYTTVSKNKKLVINKDVNRLYSSIILVLEDIKELPGVYNDEDLSNSLDNMIKYFNHKKLIKLSNSFTLNEQFCESLKILHHVSKQLDHENDHELFYTIEDFPFNITNNKEYNDFKSQVLNLLTNSHILSQFSYELSSNNSFTIENMNKFPINLNILNLGNHANLLSILPKPVLFDVGYNYINYSSTSSVSGTPEPTTVDEDKKKGFFGIFGRL